MVRRDVVERVADARLIGRGHAVVMGRMAHPTGRIPCGVARGEALQVSIWAKVKGQGSVCPFTPG